MLEARRTAAQMRGRACRPTIATRRASGRGVDVQPHVVDRRAARARRSSTGVDERLAQLLRQLLQVRAEVDLAQVGVRVVGRDRPLLRARPARWLKPAAQQQLLGLLRARRSATGPAQSARYGGERLLGADRARGRVHGGDVARRRRTARRAGRRRAARARRRANSSAWSPIQWNVAVERIASTGSPPRCRSTRARSGRRRRASTRSSPASRSRAASIIEAEPSTPITRPRAAARAAPA